MGGSVVVGSSSEYVHYRGRYIGDSLWSSVLVWYGVRIMSWIGGKGKKMKEAAQSIAYFVVTYFAFCILLPV